MCSSADTSEAVCIRSVPNCDGHVPCKGWGLLKHPELPYEHKAL